MMRVLSIITGCIACVIVSGCACGNYILLWTVEGQIVHAETGNPISGEITAFLLLRDGASIGSCCEEGSFVPIPLDPEGNFDFSVFLGISRLCDPIILPLPENVSLGDPPDGIEVVITLEDGEDLRITVPVLDEDVVDIIEAKGVPVVGRIDLGVLEV